MKARGVLLIAVLAVGAMPMRASAEKTEFDSTRFWVLSGDVNAMLWVAVGPTADQMLAYCANGSFGGPVATTHVALLTTGAGDAKTMATVTGGDLPTLVWRATEVPDFAEDWYDLESLACAALAANGFLATGTTDARYQDHGGGAPDQTEPDVWTFQARGLVFGAEGDAWFLNHAGRCAWFDFTTTDTLTCQTHVLLSPR